MSSNSLFALIHSLNPSEKRYIRLYAQRQVQSRNTNYFKIFEAINNQEQYDEEALLKKFRRENFVKQFAVAKNYLFHMILKRMQEYNEQNFIEWKIRNMFLQVKILASKGLDSEAAKLIKKTKELAWQYEYHHVIMDVLHIEKYLFGNFRIYEPTEENFAAIVNEDNHSFAMAQSLQQLGHVWHYLTLLELEIGVLPVDTIKKRAEACVNVNCMKQEPIGSYNTRFRYFATWSLYYNLIDNQQQNYECCRQCILIREEQIEKQPLQNMDPLASYYNFLIACEKANRWEQFEHYLDKIKAYEAATIEVNIRRMHNYCWCGLMYYLHLQQYDKAYAVVNEYKAFFVDNNIQFRKDFKIYIEAACGLVCFFNQRFKEAINWWNTILNSPQSQVELRSQGAVRLYLMMLHYEEDNTNILDYLAKQAQTFLKQIAMWHKPEQLFVSALLNITSIQSTKARQAALEQLYQQLQECTLSVSGNAVNQFMLHWIKQKIM
jgi:hypothetical protein